MTSPLARFDPLAGATRWSETMEQFFNDACRSEGTRESALLSPAIDVGEDESRISITAELPGLERKDIELTVKDGILTLRGEKRMDSESREGKFHRIERRYGSFYRAIALPDTV